ncbi:Do family serine endopeptidase [Dyella sp. GSA-30]|uniref:Do family serine endopeptidase n=1 Tax=Dyella sp. GSA-30 TaxID=2994496 RepID=UPI002493552F|nr:Do family serine endopeptidase [Dyella sp. GSA-30]BDU19963.1 heat-shock protein [Dyella sp. GSA-30]
MYPRHRRLAVIFSAVLASVLPLIGRAALPPSVDGQPLPSLAPMLEKVTPAVVNISTKTRVKVRDPFFDDPVFRQMFGLNGGARERVEQSLGSGVIVDAAKGYVLTNNHVVGGADDISVTLQDGRNFKGKLIGTDPETDVAVVQIQGTDLKALPLANSDQLRVGDFVVAVGDPFGLGQTATSGIVSALRRSGLGNSGYQNFIQTDASINPGNSGGALVNLRGELVGINTMIFSPSGGNVGIGFAIPTNLSSEVMQQLIAHGKVSRGTLGIDTQEITPRIAQVLGLKSSEGVVVTRVSNGSVADQADVQTGDVITAVDGKPLRNPQDLRNSEGLLPVGSSVKLTVTRGGTPRDITLKLTPEKLATLDGGKLDARLVGVTFSELPQNLRSQGVAGVQIASVAKGSRAEQSGLKQGDILLGIGNLRVTSLNTMQRLAGVNPRQLLLVVSGDEGTRYVQVL